MKQKRNKKWKNKVGIQYTHVLYNQMNCIDILSYQLQT